MTETLLVINAGSSSIKFCLYRVAAGDALELRFKGQFDGIGTHPRLRAKAADGTVLKDESFPDDSVATVPEALDRLDDWLLAEMGGVRPIGIGHRVVHGGATLSHPVKVDDAILALLDTLVPLAPLHQPNNLAPIRIIRDRLPGVPQVACFDTAFHRRHPEVADLFAIPYALYEEGVRRYGFHGLSYAYIAERLIAVDEALARGKVVVCHLGSGASACAIANGRSMDSTMGFTALDGLPMGTRSGQLDPGVVLYMIQSKGYDAAALETLLYRESGLKGLSGLSNDMRDLQENPAPAARRAVDYFVSRVVREIGGLAAAMDGLDGIVFTAGIGENSPVVRARVLERLGWLGVDFDAEANAAQGPLVTRPGSRVKAYVIPTDEELMIAAETLAVLRAG
jgi:acetate kinase